MHSQNWDKHFDKYCDRCSFTLSQLKLFPLKMPWNRAQEYNFHSKYERGNKDEYQKWKYERKMIMMNGVR